MVTEWAVLFVMNRNRTMKTCNYPYCQKTELNEYGLCSNHAVDYGQKEKSVEKVQSLLQFMAKSAAPLTQEQEEEKSLEQDTFSILVLGKKVEVPHQEGLL
jgi:hypothetical protein